ncbi:MAG: mannose-1-phosphate guanylyltransferase/mannose-6-phosphate isomerase [Pseudomonadota bacterium]
MIRPVILAGGAGTRLWPLSRKSFPKQFADLGAGVTLFQDTVRRAQGGRFSAPTIVTGKDFRFIVAEQLDQIGLDPATGGADILLEPEGRNTAPAILAAALRHEETPDDVLLVMPSDHRIEDERAFRAAVRAGASAARNGAIVTFGICPTRPETGYGYLQLSKPAVPGEAQSLVSFAEKPGPAEAERMVESGAYLWNAGIFMFRVADILQAFDRLAPKLMLPAKAALRDAQQDLCFTALGAEPYARCADISIDYAIMERASALTVIPLDCGWTDLGSWHAVLGASARDDAGNAASGRALQIDCKDTLLRSDGDGPRLVGLGLTNVAAIATGDAVLVANLDAGDRVKEVVAELKLQEAEEAESFRQCHRPWGHYETLSLGERFQVKRIMVKPGGKLSLQSHVHRSEHWVVVEGTAHVTVGSEIRVLTENESVYIPLGEIHRLENRGRLPLTLIEVQSGAYLGEDDIVRYEDVYARVERASETEEQAA